MFFIAKWAARAGKILIPLGGKGLFFAALLDSSFIPLPEGVDLWLVSLSIMQPARMPYYVLLAVLGSVLGCCAVFFVARRAEEMFLEKNPKYRGLPRIQRLVEKYESGALLIGAILPPPTPFKLVVIAAGVLKCRFDRFLIALVVGRTIRYAAEGLLAIRYGHQVWGWLVSAGPAAFGLIVLAMLLALLAHRTLGKAPAAEG